MKRRTGQRRQATGQRIWAALMLLAACRPDPLADGLPRNIDCASCHGSHDSPAPPPALSGAVDPADPAVGAHAQHLAEQSWHRTLACAECHQPVTDLLQPGHFDDSPAAEVVFGALASADGASPSYHRDDFSCSGVYCHGATLLPPGSNRQPVWNQVGSGQANCGSCHGLPPQGGHPPQKNCSMCHPCVTDEHTHIAYPRRHIDGQVNLEAADACPAP